jgi:hypothetical protein
LREEYKFQEFGSKMLRKIVVPKEDEVGNTGAFFAAFTASPHTSTEYRTHFYYRENKTN